MTANHQRLATGLGMHLHQRPQRYGAVVKAVAAVRASLLWLMTQLRLAVVQRVMGGETLHLRAENLVESVVGRAHVGPSRSTAGARNDLRTEDRALGLHRHIGAVAMPAHVALENFEDVVVRVQDEGAVGFDVA